MMEPGLGPGSVIVWPWRGAWGADPRGGSGCARHHCDRMGGHLWGAGTASYQTGTNARDRAAGSPLCSSLPSVYNYSYWLGICGDDINKGATFAVAHLTTANSSELEL